MAFIGDIAFISYRGDHAEIARALAERLVDENDKQCNSVIFIPPGRICAPTEVLLPFEYFEVMEFILDAYYNCNAFIILEDKRYWSSYWTQMEVLQWRRFTKDQSMYIARPIGKSAQIVEKRKLPPIARETHRWLAHISLGTNRRMRRLSPDAQPFGRYARNCFLVPCDGCKRHFLVSQKKAYSSLAEKSSISCPYCNHVSALREAAEHGNFYRKPIMLLEPVSDVTPPSEEILNALLVDNELPPGIAVVTLPDEKLKSDVRKVMEVYGWMALGLLVVGAAIETYNAITGQNAEDNSD
jgi:hypothetical protein